MSNPDITMSEKTVHNPSEPRHFMRMKPIEGRVRILRLGNVLADTTKALRVLEVGRDFYDPTIYVPIEDIHANLEQTDKATHCPIKGDAVYYDLVRKGGETVAEEIAWAYPEPIDASGELAGRIAFYGGKVTIEESPKGS